MINKLKNALTTAITGKLTITPIFLLFATYLYILNIPIDNILKASVGNADITHTGHRNIPVFAHGGA